MSEAHVPLARPSLAADLPAAPPPPVPVAGQPPPAAASFGRDTAARVGLTVSGVADVQLPTTRAHEVLAPDGRVWRRTWSLHDRLVIEFVGVTRVDVSGRTDEVVFDRVLRADVQQHLLLDHVLPLMLVRRGALVLHGAVISAAERAVVLLGRTGAGKSTMTAYAWKRGWTVGGDDGAIVHLGAPVTVEPTYPTIRLTPDSTELLGLDGVVGSDVVGKTRLSDEGESPFSQSARRLALVVVLDPAAPGAACRLARLRGVDAHAAVFAAAFDIGSTEGRRKRLEDVGELVTQVQVARLTVPRTLDGLVAGEELLRTTVLGTG